MAPLEPILATCLGYALLALGLTSLLISHRSWLTLTGKRTASSFAVDGSDLSPFSQRLCRAHANCYENAPYLCLIAFSAYASGDLTPLNALAPLFLGARIAQSTLHLLSTSDMAVTVRAVFFFLQLFIQVYWVLSLFFQA